ncbi:hypothetical protein NQ317_019149 [Molorchus minor]|uniref:Lipid scramblase CLPTM1L n=1 Tax=Molorchus minor TaxID=1323400 RepID=A0ABQ9JNS3_9CUCU|nr:hypothetical protein NQ317_019149 [Molorchus minor]
MKPSISYIFTGLFFAFILRSIYSLYGIFQTPDCKERDVCYSSFLNTKRNLDLVVFVSDNSKSGNFERVLHLQKFNYTIAFEKDVPLNLSKTVRNNGSLFIHTVIVPHRLSRKSVDITSLINAPNSTYIRNRMTKYAVPVSATFNLLKNSNWTESKGAIKPVSHLLKQDFLNMRLHDLVEITPETRSINFTYIYSPTSLGKLKFLMHIENTLHSFLNLGFTEKDLDEVKGVFADTNLYLLCATISIGSIHLLLDFLSFKNDVSFWKSQTSMAGLSSRTVIWRTFSQTIVFLYLLDEGTSLLVLIPSGIATIIEFWKVSKVFKTSISWTGLKVNRDNKETIDEKKTREYDKECMRYLSYILYPLCVGAAVYSLLYQPHKSWYSWTINSLVNGVYAFGFLFMFPQLFINYRLKSVAALPWRAFTYKAFNTFIDDLFAFIITMPIAHRVACFRDDVVFLIYLYQRWLYPVDKTRIDDISGETVIQKEEKKTK